jgi:hypothetical protein
MLLRRCTESSTMSPFVSFCVKSPGFYTSGSTQAVRWPLLWRRR